MPRRITVSNNIKTGIFTVIFLRIAAAILIIFNPFLGFILTLVFDFIDAYFLKHLFKMPWSEYHRLDKYVDWFTYICMFYVGVGVGYFWSLGFWLLVRFCGQVAYMYTKRTEYFILFPNFFEVAFLWLVVLKERPYFSNNTTPETTWLLFLFLIKVIQELWIHLFWPKYLKKNGYPKFLHKIGYERKIVWR